MRLASMALCALLSGCAGTVNYVGGGQVYKGTFNKVGRTMTAVIDGRTYRGSYVLQRTVGFGVGTAFSGGTIATGFGSTSSTSNNARATLISDDGKALRCEFMAGFMEASGICQDTDGRTYDMMAGG